ncbi:MAG: hypothetical protein JWR50_1066 [Mucilaginibacter sp.]|nr:hypothetical protein [Mucilaginibacter sp.]
MKKLLLFIGYVFITCSVYAQVASPKFKSNSSDNPFTTIKNYDLLIACRAYDNVAHSITFNVMVLKNGHWHKLTYKQNVSSAPLSVTEPPFKDAAATDAQCQSVYNSLVADKLFSVNDDSNLPKCNENTEKVDGTEQKVSHSTEDGSEYRLWLITPSKTRYLYYYAPEFFANYCPDNKDRKEVVKIVGLLK